MKQNFSKYKVFLLFFCGFLIGIYLEILLIGSGTKVSNPLQDTLKEGINITCLVIIKHQHLRYVNSSKKTWLRHCDNYRIVNIRRDAKSVDKNTSKDFNKFQNIINNYTVCSENGDVKNIDAKSGWEGLCKAFYLVKENYDQWLVIIPDSLVLLIENLRHFVSNKNSDEPHYYGHTLKNYEADYNVLSAGILISRGALKKLLEKFPKIEDCENSGKFWKNEDLFLGKYLKENGIFPKDSRDEEGRGRFHGYNLNNILWPGKLFKQSDYNTKALYPVSQGFNCCSPFLITMDISDPDSMRNLYFLLYKLKTNHNKFPPPAKINKTKDTFWKEFLRKEGYNESEIDKMTNEEYYKIWEKKLPTKLMYKQMRTFLENNKESFD